MPSFDIVNRLDLQEADNAVNNTKKTISNRYDFKDSRTEIEFNKKDKKIHVVTQDEMKMRAVVETLIGCMVKRQVDPKVLDQKKVEPTSNGMVKGDIFLKEGIETDLAKKIVKMIKDTKMKVQAQIQDNQIRVTAKQIDDLQSVIQLLKEKELEIPLQFVNMQR